MKNDPRRILYLPKPCMSPDTKMVCIRLPLDDPNEYIETMLTADEACNFALELMIDASRARGVWVRK